LLELIGLLPTDRDDLIVSLLKLPDNLEANSTVGASYSNALHDLAILTVPFTTLSFSGRRRLLFLPAPLLAVRILGVTADV
jgi:hypothetical protein